IWILGRIDDVINISGHRLSTIEIESALVSHPNVIEAGVTPVPDAKTGHCAIAFVVPRGDFHDEAARQELTQLVAKQIGPVAKPRDIVFVPDVPKTRSGNIMRRLLTQLYTGDTLGDTTSLQNDPAGARTACGLKHR